MNRYHSVEEALANRNADNEVMELFISHKSILLSPICE